MDCKIRLIFLIIKIISKKSQAAFFTPYKENGDSLVNGTEIDYIYSRGISIASADKLADRACRPKT